MQELRQKVNIDKLIIVKENNYFFVNFMQFVSETTFRKRKSYMRHTQGRVERNGTHFAKTRISPFFDTETKISIYKGEMKRFLMSRNNGRIIDRNIFFLLKKTVNYKMCPIPKH